MRQIEHPLEIGGGGLGDGMAAYTNLVKSLNRSTGEGRGCETRTGMAAGHPRNYT
jgi:hypothetical protein